MQHNDKIESQLKMGGQQVHLVIKTQIETNVVFVQREARHELIQPADHQVIQWTLVYVDGGIHYSRLLNIHLLLHSDRSYRSRCLRLLTHERTS